MLPTCHPSSSDGMYLSPSFHFGGCARSMSMPFDAAALHTSAAGGLLPHSSSESASSFFTNTANTHTGVRIPYIYQNMKIRIMLLPVPLPSPFGSPTPRPVPILSNLLLPQVRSSPALGPPPPRALSGGSSCLSSTKSHQVLLPFPLAPAVLSIYPSATTPSSSVISIPSSGSPSPSVLTVYPASSSLPTSIYPVLPSAPSPLSFAPIVPSYNLSPSAPPTTVTISSPSHPTLSIAIPSTPVNALSPYSPVALSSYPVPSSYSDLPFSRTTAMNNNAASMTSLPSYQSVHSSSHVTTQSSSSVVPYTSICTASFPTFYELYIPVFPAPLSSSSLCVPRCVACAFFLYATLWVLFFTINAYVLLCVML